MLDVSLDADSELICAVEVLPANGDEAANAPQLSASEEHAHGNDIASLSVARSGYRGAVRAELREATNGPHLPVYVPPIAWLPPTPELFQPTDFPLTEVGDEVRCPGGATTSTRQRATRGHGWQFHFRTSPCRTCPLRARGRKPQTPGGRTVIKNDSAAQYRAAQQRAPTPAYPEVRREQPRIERKLAEIIRWHDGRRVRSRGRLRVKMQYVLTAVVVNGKRIVKLLKLPRQPQLA